MKKVLILSIMVMFFYSCSKNSPSIPDPQTASKISSIPSSFVQKVVIENFTMTSCGQCPKSHLILDSLINFNQGRVYGMTIHVDDVMQDTTLLTTNGRNYYDSLFNPTQVYPSGMVNRRVNTLNDIIPDNWSSTVFSAIGNVPSCGIAIEAEDIINETLHLIVHIGYTTSMLGQYNIHAFIVQDQVYSNDSLYDQMNDFSSVGSTPDSTSSLYALDDTIHLYKHNYVLKKVIADNGPDGDPIPLGSMYAGNHFTKGYNVNLAGINTNNSYILIYVDKYATTLSGHSIENVQIARFGTTKDWN